MEWRFEDESIAVYALRFERGIKLEIRDAYTNPGEEIGNGSQFLEPFENCSRSRRAAEVGKKRNRRRDPNAEVWYSSISDQRMS